MTERLTTILQAEGLEHLLTNFTDQGVTDSILGDLSDSDLKDLGVDKLGERKRLLAAFKGDAPSELGVAVASQAVVAETPAFRTPSTVATPTEATKDSPFVNSLGMPFVPIPRFDTRFCIWTVRVQDYETYCMSTGVAFPSCPFPQEGDHPIVGVTWNDAKAFCAWLTKKEREEGKIDSETAYRLPTDLEWSSAVGLPHEPEDMPGERNLKLPGYPWGLRWPPPKNAGNYEGIRSDTLNYKSQIESVREIENQWVDLAQNPDNPSIEHSWKMAMQRGDEASALELKQERYETWIKAWTPVDNFEFTSPVGSFSGNQFGIYDLGGNVWELCEDAWSRSHRDFKIARGASYMMTPKDGDDNLIPNQDAYRSSFRIGTLSSERICQNVFYNGEWKDYPDGGFRIVLAADHSKEDSKKWLENSRKYFINTNLFEFEDQFNNEALEIIQRTWEENNGDIASIANAFFQSGKHEFSEAFYIAALENSTGKEQYKNSIEPAQWAFNLGLCIPDTRISEKINLLKKYYDQNPLWADILRYNLACYNCIAGNLEYAKELLLQKFQRDKEQLLNGVDIDYALNDQDLHPLKEFLQQIKNQEKQKIELSTSAGTPPEITVEIPSKQELSKKGIFSGNVIAALASFFIPGLGQLLQGRLFPAILFFVFTGILWIFLLGWVIHLWACLDAARWKPRGL